MHTHEIIKKNHLDEDEFEESRDKTYITHFDFEKRHYFRLSADEQLDLLRKWIVDLYKRLVDYSNPGH